MGQRHHPEKLNHLKKPGCSRSGKEPDTGHNMSEAGMGLGTSHRSSGMGLGTSHRLSGMGLGTSRTSSDMGLGISHTFGRELGISRKF